MSLRQIRFLSIILMMAFVLCAGFIYKFNKSASINSDISNIIINLAVIDADMSLNFQNIIAAENYDDINKNIENFNRNLTVLKELNARNLVVEVYDMSQNIARLEKFYDTKKKLSDNASYISSRLNTLIAVMKHETDSSVEPIYARLKNIRTFDKERIDRLARQIDTFLSASNAQSARATFLKKANYALELINELAKISEQNDSLKFQEFIREFRADQITQYKKLISKLRVFQIISFGIFFVLLAFVIYQTRKSVDNAKKISMLETMIDSDHSSIVFTDTENKILYANKTFEKVTGYKTSEVIGQRPNLLKSGMHSEEFYSQLRESVRKGEAWESNELISRAKNGKMIHERVKILPFYFEKKLQGYIAIKLDRTKEASMINELAVKNEQIKAQSTIDKLTGFGNYFALTERLESREDGMIICMSVKNFKTLRFFYQTKVIDEIIRSIASTLRLCVDTTEMNAVLYRFADDSFYIWYQGEHIVRDIAYLREYFSFGNLELVVEGKKEALPGLKIVLGVSLPNDTMQTNRLMQSVLANQQAFNSNKELYYYQENDAIEMQHYKNQITTQLIEYALQNDMVIVECQGIYDVQFEDEEANFYEVLVRLIDQSGKIRYPGEFLSVAMQTQLYTQITKKVIEHAFALVERYPHYTFSVNLSGSDIADVSVRELLEDKLRVCSKPEHVCFEMLESEEMEDYDTIRSFIRRIKGYGCKISIDDFGSGYSNYYRILELDIDNIKIDGSIIKKLPFDQNARMLVETIVNFASKQGYKIVAEFVSSPEILEQVKHFGIKYAQGFLLGKPKRMN